MTVSIVCSNCSRKLTAPEKAAGKTLKCPACGKLLAIQRIMNQPRRTDPDRPPIRESAIPDWLDDVAQPKRADLEPPPQGRSPRPKAKKDTQTILFLLGIIAILTIILASSILSMTGQFKPFSSKTDPVSGSEMAQARQSLDNALDACEEMKPGWGLLGMIPPHNPLSKLLDYKIISFDAKRGGGGNYFVASVVIQLETHAFGEIGGGPVVAYQVIYEIRRSSGMDPNSGPWSIYQEKVKRYFPVP